MTDWDMKKYMNGWDIEKRVIIKSNYLQRK